MASIIGPKRCMWQASYISAWLVCLRVLSESFSLDLRPEGFKGIHRDQGRMVGIGGLVALVPMRTCRVIVILWVGSVSDWGQKEG